MIKDLYKKENNIFQSSNWLAFQESYGRKVVHFSDCSGIEIDLPFSRKAIWIQKAPLVVTSHWSLATGLDRDVVFVRVEPSEMSEKDTKELNLKRVTENSLLSGQKSPKATQIIDISGSEEDILTAMKSKTRYNIRLSSRKGVTVKVTDDTNILYELLLETEKRQKGYNLHPKKYYTKLISDLGKHGVVKIFVAYNKEQNPIAATLISFFGEVATYLHGGFSDKDKNLMAPFLCHMEAIRYAKEHGCKYYDMWGVAETDDPKDPWAGITRFKQGFGGEKIVFPGSYDIVLNKHVYYALTLLAKIRRLIR